jgi:hypothetical protein
METGERRVTRGVEQAFAAADLPAPEVPAHWAPRLRERDEWLFCTGEPPQRSLYDFDEYVELALAGSIENGLTIGLQGYGVNNHALHYYLVEDELLLLLQWRWGNAYDNPDECRQRLTAACAALSRLLAEFGRVRAAGTPLPGRLTVLDGRSGARRWTYAPPPPALLPSFYLDWNAARDPLSAALADLRAR